MYLSAQSHQRSGNNISSQDKHYLLLSIFDTDESFPLVNHHRLNLR